MPRTSGAKPPGTFLLVLLPLAGQRPEHGRDVWRWTNEEQSCRGSPRLNTPTSSSGRTSGWSGYETCDGCSSVPTSGRRTGATSPRSPCGRSSMSTRRVAWSLPVCSQLAGDKPDFFLHGGREESVLCCLGCGSKTRIEHRPWARSEAEAEHECHLECGCWSTKVHTRSGGAACADG